MNVAERREVEAKAVVINKSGLFGRLVGYFIAYAPMAAIWAFVMMLALPEQGLTNSEVINFLIFVVVLVVPPLLPFIVWEKKLRAWRRERGLPINKNIEKELAQLELDERMLMEQEALKRAGAVTAINKDDLGYWHDLLQKGAITQEEYAVKKAELL